MFFYSPLHLFNKCLLKAHYMSGTTLGFEKHQGASKNCLCRAYTLCGEQRQTLEINLVNKQVNHSMSESICAMGKNKQKARGGM